MVKNKDPREVRERVIKLYYEALKGMNFGSDKNIDNSEEVAMGLSHNDSTLAVSPIQTQNTSGVDLDDVYYTDLPVSQMGTNKPEKKVIIIGKRE